MIQLSILGNPQLTMNDNPVRLTAGKAYALLAYLALTDATHSREFLINLLWANSDPTAARKNLRNHLSLIRKAVGDEMFVVDNDYVGLSKHVAIDAIHFADAVSTQLHGSELHPQQLATSLDTWRGPLLDTVRVTEAPDFELWLLSERERLGCLFAQGLHLLTRYFIESEEWEKVIETCRRGLAFDHTDEELAYGLMKAYTLSGRKTLALKVYEQLKKALDRELGVHPLQVTDELRKAILGNDLSIIHSETQGKFSQKTSISQIINDDSIRAELTPARPATTPIFVGRAAEIETLDACVTTQVGQ